MSHPWLEIPIADYEAHMALPSVGQAQLLSDALRRTVAEFRPRSLAVLGVAGGNGLESVFNSLARLESAFSFVDPAFLERHLSAHGFSRVIRDRYDLDSGKSFYYASYHATNAAFVQQISLDRTRAGHIRCQFRRH